MRDAEFNKNKLPKKLNKKEWLEDNTNL